MLPPHELSGAPFRVENGTLTITPIVSSFPKRSYDLLFTYTFLSFVLCKSKGVLKTIERFG